jgi:4-hydroxy-3-polyprenylbenzoate decarboxylase
MTPREPTDQRTIIVAVTGASGAVFAQKILRTLEDDRRVGRVHLVVSNGGILLLKHELGISAKGRRKLSSLIVGGNSRKIECLDNEDVGASIASGSYPVDGMVIMPCSMGTLGAIAHGAAETLIQRAADVTLKERRPLVLAVRDTPFSRIHLENMLRCQQAGALIFPIIPSFYHRPRKIDDLVSQYVFRVLAHLGLAQEKQYSWKGLPPSGGPEL